MGGYTYLLYKICTLAKQLLRWEEQSMLILCHCSQWPSMPILSIKKSRLFHSSNAQRQSYFHPMRKCGCLWWDSSTGKQVLQISVSYELLNTKYPAGHSTLPALWFNLHIKYICVSTHYLTRNGLMVVSAATLAGVVLSWGIYFRRHIPGEVKCGRAQPFPVIMIFMLKPHKMEDRATHDPPGLLSLILNWMGRSSPITNNNLNCQVPPGHQ